MSGVDLLAALGVFVAVAMAVGSIALFWEGIRAVQRQRAATRALQRIEGTAEKPAKGASEDSILREGEGEEEVGLGALLHRIPHRADLVQMLEQAGVRWGVGTFLLLSLGSCVAFGLAGGILFRSGIMFAAFAGLGMFGPWLWVKRKKAKRIGDFEELFPDALDLLTRSIRAGHAFTTGLKVVAEESEEPLRGEFRQIYEEQRFGLPLEESLLGLADRMDLVDVRLFVTSVLIQKEAGGNLAEKLQNLSSIIRARFKFRRQVRIHTAHGRMTGTVVGLAPFFATLGLWLINPDYMEPLFTEPMGRMLIGFSMFWMMIGFVVIRRITDIQF
jgi:tight adherence protein B